MLPFIKFLLNFGRHLLSFIGSLIVVIFHQVRVNRQ